MTTTISNIKIVKRPGTPEPKEDPKLGLAQFARRIDREIAEHGEMVSVLLGDGELAAQAPIYYLESLRGKLEGVGLEDPVSLRFEDIPHPLWWPLLAASNTATGFQRLLERFNAFDGALVFEKHRGNSGALRVRVSVDSYRLCDRPLCELLDERRWRAVWEWVAEDRLAFEPVVAPVVRQDYLERQRRKLGIDGS
jgi:hypothetical protein